MNKQVNKQSKQANLWKDNVSSEIERYSRLSFIQQAYGFTKHVRVVIIQFSQHSIMVVAIYRTKKRFNSIKRCEALVTQLQKVYLNQIMWRSCRF